MVQLLQCLPPMWETQIESWALDWPGSVAVAGMWEIYHGWKLYCVVEVLTENESLLHAKSFRNKKELAVARQTLISKIGLCGYSKENNNGHPKKSSNSHLPLPFSGLHITSGIVPLDQKGIPWFLIASVTTTVIHSHQIRSDCSTPAKFRFQYPGILFSLSLATWPPVFLFLTFFVVNFYSHYSSTIGCHIQISHF